MNSQLIQLTQQDVDEWNKRAAIRMAETNDFIIKSIDELLEKNFKTFQGLTFSSKGMSEMQVAHFLVKETDKLLFPDGEGYFSSIVNDEYDDTQGPAGMLKIISRYANWVDLSAESRKFFK